MKPAKNHPIIYTSYFLMVAAVVKPNVKSSILAVVVSAVTKMGNKNISDSSLKLVLFTSCFDCNYDCSSNEIQAFTDQLYCFIIHSDVLLVIIFLWCSVFKVHLYQASSRASRIASATLSNVSMRSVLKMTFMIVVPF